MGVERQAAKVNWITSMAMIVTAGTLFRLRRLTKSLTSVKAKELLVKLGMVQETKPRFPTIVGPKISEKPGEWEEVMENRRKYKALVRAYRLCEGSFALKRRPTDIE